MPGYSRRIGYLGCALLASVMLAAGTAQAASPDEQGNPQQRHEHARSVVCGAAFGAAGSAERRGLCGVQRDSTKILLAGGGGGKGVVVDTISDQETFMLMATLQAGYGMGITKTHLVWVFQNEADVKNFIANGYMLGADTYLQANPGAGGAIYQGAAQIQPGVWLYQLSDAGLALDLTVEGTEYFKDPDLN